MKTYSDKRDPTGIAWQRYSLHGETMGTRYSAVFFAAPGADEAAINARLFAAVDEVDRQMSNWKPDSALNRLNNAPVDQWLAVPDELFTVLEAALSVSRQSHGAFDIGVGNLVSAWGFGPGEGHIDEQRINGLKAQAYRPATDVLEIDSLHRRVRKRATIMLDLSGIAKGYGVDQLARCLDMLGITRYLVGIDGEMRARDTKPDGQPWSIAIEKPVRDVRDVMGVMELSDAAIATSGDYRHWVEHDGKSYAHTIDGPLRQPASNRLAAVSIVASNCMFADAWATALLVLGEKAGIELAQKRGMTALFVLHHGDGFQEISVTDGELSGDPPAVQESVRDD
ncbi:FAD:protein FMN transferase [Thermomonas sp.]|uniref:FAD:protein FMN transferase n=1 Tax=Thermomonas sp. TaxID=1971895 RepID=UPI002486F51B|nr:FAD:protein FMN transferase [Thermomonas sp.]MDI1253176.1 FAD:protein FMN transferase [Thermomonas sp.]